MISFRTVRIVAGKELIDLFRDVRTVLAGILLPVILVPVSFSMVSREMVAKAGGGVAMIVGAEDTASFRMLGGAEGISVHEAARKEDLRSCTVDLLLRVEAGSAVITADARRSESLQRAAALAALLRPPVAGARVVTEYLDAVPPERAVIPFVLPLILIMFCAVSPLSATADLFAGEKERGTMESLLATPARRSEILIGKYVASGLMGAVQAGAFLVGLALAIATSPKLFGAAGGSFLSPGAIGVIGVLLLFLIFFFSVFYCIVAIFARSSRECQTVALPFIALVSFLGYHVMLAPLPVSGAGEYLLPVSGIGVAVKGILAGIYAPELILLTLGVHFFYLIALLSLAAVLFRSERVVFRN